MFRYWMIMKFEIKGHHTVGHYATTTPPPPHCDTIGAKYTNCTPQILMLIIIDLNINSW